MKLNNYTCEVCEEPFQTTEELEDGERICDSCDEEFDFEDDDEEEEDEDEEDEEEDMETEIEDDEEEN